MYVQKNIGLNTKTYLRANEHRTVDIHDNYMQTNIDL